MPLVFSKSKQGIIPPIQMLKVEERQDATRKTLLQGLKKKQCKKCG
jgi:hypothetical protein